MATIPATYNYDLSDAISQVRFLIQDVSVGDLPGETAPDTTVARNRWSCIFIDAEITAVVGRYGENATNLAAADLLDAIASNAAFLAKKVVLGDFQSDTNSTAKQLHAQADVLRHLGADIPFDAFSEIVYNDFDWRRKLFNSALTGSS